MTERKVSTQFPVIFQNVEKYEKEDSRFLKVKIWLMHTGQNFNGSSFSKEAVDKAIPTLANTPILAFIEENSEGEQDFSDHRMVLHRSSDGEFDFKYLGSAVGVIPEVNNAHWEMRVTDSGEEKEYLVVDALMWTKWGEPTDIMSLKGQTAQSMELASDYTGYYDDNNVFHFETFSFFGACLLGSDVAPAMQNSTVEVQFNKNDDLKNTIENKLEEFYTLFSQQGGTGKMEDATKQENFEQVEQTESTEQVDEVVETEAVDEATEAETTEEVFTESTEATETNVEDAEQTEATETNTDKEDEVEPAQEFALTSNQLENQIRKELRKQTHTDRWGDTCYSHWYVDRTDEQVIFENSEDGYQLHAAPYTITGDAVTINFDEAYKVKIEYAPFEGESTSFASQFERIESEKEASQKELDELKSYKRSREEEDIKSQFTDKLSEEEFTQVFDSMKEASIADVEDKLFALYGKKNFSVKQQNTQTNKAVFSLPQATDEDQNPYGDIFK